MTYQGQQKAEKKASFLSIIKWCSRQTGAKIIFDKEEGECPTADIPNRIIHMPKKVAVANSDVVLAILIHESMHIKHTPKWLSTLCRDPVDHFIFNALEDCRIETIAVGQLRALTYFLKKLVVDARRIDRSDRKLGEKVLLNIACHASRSKLCDEYDVRRAEIDNRALITDIKDLYRRIFTVSVAKSFQANVQDLYVKIDEYRKIFNMPKVDPKKEKKEKQPANGVGGEDLKAQVGEDKVQATEKSLQQYKGQGPATGVGDEETLDLTELAGSLVDINEQAKARIKESLKKSVSAIIDEGTMLNCDNLTALLTGDIDEVFTDTQIVKSMRTKVYFLMDVSGSMLTGRFHVPDINNENNMPNDVSRLTVAVSAFKAISEVMDEARNEYGVDLEYENFMFNANCVKVDKMTEDFRGSGGGTNLLWAFKVVMKAVRADDPANKRIVCVLTDGEVKQVDEIQQLLMSEAQDIRIVFVGIGEDASRHSELIKKRHSITSPEFAEATLINTFEEAL